MIFEQSAKVNTIIDHIDVADSSIEKGKNEIKEAFDISEDNDSFTNKACIASVIIVVVLVFMMIILPE